IQTQSTRNRIPILNTNLKVTRRVLPAMLRSKHQRLRSPFPQPDIRRNSKLTCVLLSTVQRRSIDQPASRNIYDRIVMSACLHVPTTVATRPSSVHPISTTRSKAPTPVFETMYAIVQAVGRAS